MQLQKLVYYAHGWHLGLIDKPLLDEEIQAWSFGPVVRSIYNEFREFGADEITCKALTMEPGSNRPSFTLRAPSIDDVKAEEHDLVKPFLNKVWDVYKGYTGTQLSNMTHEPNTPWSRVKKVHNGQIPKYAVIPQEWIREYFKDKAEEKYA